MRITHKKTIDRQAVGKAQAELDAKRAFAAKEMQELRERRKAVGAKPGEGRVGGWHRDAVFNAVEQYGPEVLSGAAQGFWDDMKRLYPESCADDRVPGTDSMNGHGCKYGRVSRRYVGGKWYRWENGGWRLELELEKGSREGHERHERHEKVSSEGTTKRGTGTRQTDSVKTTNSGDSRERPAFVTQGGSSSAKATEDKARESGQVTPG